MKENNLVLEEIIDNIPYFVFWKDVNSNYLGCNKKFAESAGFSSPKDLVGKNDYDSCWTKEEADFFREIDKKVMRENRPMLNIEEPQQQLDGSTSTLLTSKVPLHDKEGNVIGILGIYTDITERKNLELDRERALKEIKDLQEQIIHTEKMRSLGEMAGGIAHEINNPLTIIKGYSSALTKLVEKDKHTKENLLDGLAKINETVERIGSIVKSLKTISHQEREDNLNYVDITKIIEDITSLSVEKFKANNISLKVEFKAPELKESQLLCNQVTLSQCLLNLLNNARDEVMKVHLRWIKIIVDYNDDSFTLQVIDSGSGISEENKSKIFQPFFTTKEVGKGTGIGLSLSKKLLEQQGAQIELCELSENTCFKIDFPRSSLQLAEKE